MIAAVYCGDGNTEREDGLNPARALAIRHRDEKAPGAGECRGNVSAGEDAGVDAVLAQNREIETSKNRNDVGQILAREGPWRRVGRKVRKQSIGCQRAAE